MQDALFNIFSWSYVWVLQCHCRCDRAIVIVGLSSRVISWSFASVFIRRKAIAILFSLKFGIGRGASHLLSTWRLACPIFIWQRKAFWSWIERITTGCWRTDFVGFFSFLCWILGRILLNAWCRIWRCWVLWTIVCVEGEGFGYWGWLSLSCCWVDNFVVFVVDIVGGPSWTFQPRCSFLEWVWRFDVKALNYIANDLHFLGE